jgi:hypothetical protein
VKRINALPAIGSDHRPLKAALLLPRWIQVRTMIFSSQCTLWLKWKECN